MVQFDIILMISSKGVPQNSLTQNRNNP